MPPQAALALTEDRRRCTGESHQALCALLEDDGQPLPVPAARRPEQALLETAVFLSCCKIGGVSEHPVGIVQVRPDEDQLTLRLANEPYVVYYWAEFLLPRLIDYDEFSDPQDRIISVPGLRYRKRRAASACTALACRPASGLPASAPTGGSASPTASPPTTTCCNPSRTGHPRNAPPTPPLPPHPAIRPRSTLPCYAASGRPPGQADTF